MTFINPAPPVDSISGRNVRLVSVTSVPVSTKVEFSPGLPNEPLYPNGVARARYLFGRNGEYGATPWYTIHGTTTIFIEPDIEPGDELYFSVVPYDGVMVQDSLQTAS